MKKLKARRGGFTGVDAHGELEADSELDSCPDRLVSKRCPSLYAICLLVMLFALFASNLPFLGTHREKDDSVSTTFLAPWDRADSPSSSQQDRRWHYRIRAGFTASLLPWKPANGQTHQDRSQGRARKKQGHEFL